MSKLVDPREKRRNSGCKKTSLAAAIKAPSFDVQMELSRNAHSYAEDIVEILDDNIMALIDVQEALNKAP